MKSAPNILILAAGQGKRMKSKIPKVLHPVLYRPMLHHVLDLAINLPHRKIVMVVGHGAEDVRCSCSHYKEILYATQNKQLGTGDAVRAAEKLLGKEKGPLLILSGDVFLLRKESLLNLIDVYTKTKASCAFLTANVPDPFGYGRVLRGLEGQVLGIKEQTDASEEEQRIREINSGIYCFDTALLFGCLKSIKAHNKQKEFYLTDVVEDLVSSEHTVSGEPVTDWQDILGVNDRSQLAAAEKILQSRVNRAYMLEGVSIQDPDSVTIDPRCEIEGEVTIERNCTLIHSKVKTGTLIETGSRLIHCEIGRKVHIKQGSYLTESQVGDECSVGPYAHLRPGSVLKSKVKIGNFVEVKKATFENGAKASHLSYIGDAKIGKDVNLGCGFITCNYDGRGKFETIIEDGVFVGSDSQTVAPVKIGKNSYIASGSTITENVPPDSLVLSRGKQVTKKGYAKKYR